jgi:phosphoribosylformylglycinamidine synthase subunit PurS
VRVRVEVRLKPGVLDPAAATIQRSLVQLGFGDVRDVAQSRVFELEIEQARPEDALAIARAMADKLLANPVIETYRVDLAG